MSDCEKSRGQALFEEVYTLKLPPPQRLILSFMARAADADGQFRKGKKYLAHVSEYGELQVKRILADLVAAGLIKMAEKHSGRRPSAYKFHLDKGEKNLTLQNEYLEMIGIQNNTSSDLSSQNDRYQNEYSENLSNQNDTLTHSHVSALTPQNDMTTGNGAPPPNTPLGDSQHTTLNGHDPGKLLIESWIAAHPEGRKPRYTYTKINRVLADSLARAGVTVQEVRELTREKLSGRSNKYEFKWLAEDIRLRREVTQAAGQNYTNDDDEPGTLAYRLKNPPPPEPEAPVPESLLVVADGKTRKAAWEAAYSQLEIQLDRASFETWLRGAKLVDWRDGAYIIQARNSYARDMLEHRLYRNVVRVLTDCGGGEVELRFEAAEREGV